MEVARPKEEKWGKKRAASLQEFWGGGRIPGVGGGRVPTGGGVLCGGGLGVETNLQTMVPLP